MLKILVPTDFSDTAFNAFKYILSLSQTMETSLTVVHSYATLSYSKSGIDEENARKVHSKFTEETEKMKALVSSFEKQPSVEFRLVEGELLQNLQEVIQKENFDAIVMGTTGNSGFENKILGSITTSIINNIELPVLSVPIYAKFEEIDAIGFTTLYDEQDKNILQRLLPLAKKYKTDVLSIHVTNAKEKVSDVKKEEFKDFFKEEPVIFIEKTSDSVSKGIFEFIDQSSVDVLCAITRNRSFLRRILEKSLTEKLSYHQSIPILVFHENYLKQ